MKLGLERPDPAPLGSAPLSDPIPIPTLTTAGSQRLFSCGSDLFCVYYLSDGFT